MEGTPIRPTLITPARLEPSAFRPLLQEALSASDVSAVVLDLGGGNAEEWRRAAEELGPLAQAAGAAFLIRDHIELVASIPCDGVHVTGGPAALDAALRALKPGYVIGAGDCTTRHSAMTLGERGPDYVFLGRFDAGEEVPPGPTLIEWWTELFELPCVALADEWDAVETAVAARADFVALRDLVWRHPEGPAAGLRRAERVIAGHSEALT